MSAQTVLDVAQVDLSSKVVSKNMSATDKKLGKHQGIFGGLYAFCLVFICFCRTKEEATRKAQGTLR